MMFARSIFTVALLALSAEMASATPPACLLGAVNTQVNPANLAGICGPNAAKVQQQIQSLCGPNTAEAMKAFSSICSANGHHVAAPKAHPKPKPNPSSKSHAKPHATMQGSHMGRPTGHSRPHAPHSKQAPHHTPSATHASNTQHAVHHAPPTGAGSAGNVRQTPSPSSTSQDKPFDGAAGHVDANAFAALAMAAAGLAIFL